MTEQEILKVFSKDDDTHKRAWAKYLAECMRIEVSLSAWDGEHPEELFDRLQQARIGADPITR